jgi:hypothetical protein
LNYAKRIAFLVKRSFNNRSHVSAQIQFKEIGKRVIIVPIGQPFIMRRFARLLPRGPVRAGNVSQLAR